MFLCSSELQLHLLLLHLICFLLTLAVGSAGNVTDPGLSPDATAALGFNHTSPVAPNASTSVNVTELQTESSVTQQTPHNTPSPLSLTTSFKVNVSVTSLNPPTQVHTTSSSTQQPAATGRQSTSSATRDASVSHFTTAGFTTRSAGPSLSPAPSVTGKPGSNTHTVVTPVIPAVTATVVLPHFLTTVKTTNAPVSTTTITDPHPSPGGASQPDTRKPAAQDASLSTGAATLTTNKASAAPAATQVDVVEAAGGALTRQLVDTASLMAVLLFGLLFFLVTVAVFLTQAYESYRRKDYTQVDYLINGMYIDSGV